MFLSSRGLSDGRASALDRESFIQCSGTFFWGLALRVARLFHLFRSSTMEALIIGARGNDMQGDSKRRGTQPFLAERHRRAGIVL